MKKLRLKSCIIFGCCCARIAIFQMIFFSSIIHKLFTRLYPQQSSIRNRISRILLFYSLSFIFLFHHKQMPHILRQEISASAAFYEVHRDIPFTRHLRPGSTLIPIQTRRNRKDPIPLLKSCLHGAELYESNMVQWETFSCTDCII
jgi:hypothetical protein